MQPIEWVLAVLYSAIAITIAALLIHVTWQHFRQAR